MRHVAYRPPLIEPPQPVMMDGRVSSATPVSFQPPRLEFIGRAALAVEGRQSNLAQEHDGPNPYVDYARRYTAEDGVAFIYKTIDENSWRTVLRVLVLLFAVTLAFAYQVDASPYPILPRGCRPFGPCPVSVPGDRLALNLLLLAGFGVVCAQILFVEVQVYRQVEIRPDCMILDGTDVFWADRFELGWPKFRHEPDGMLVLAGVYGTRDTEFLKLKAFDDNDRGPQVFAAHLAAAMRQQWEQTT